MCNLSEQHINEICKAFALGWTIEHISNVEQLTVEQVKEILNSNTERVQELKAFYKAMEV